MGTQPGGPPNKWSDAFSTKGMTDPAQLSQALNAAAAKGFTGEPFKVPSPVPTDPPNTEWVTVPGYQSSEQ